MKETDAISEILASLNQYVEKQEKLVDEQNQALLEQGRREFEAAIEQRKVLFEKSEDEYIERARTKPTIRALYGDLLLKGRGLSDRLSGALRRAIHRLKRFAAFK